jgi:hypothetical protein
METMTTNHKTHDVYMPNHVYDWAANTDSDGDLLTVTDTQGMHPIELTVTEGNAFLRTIITNLTRKEAKRLAKALLKAAAE